MQGLFITLRSLLSLNSSSFHVKHPISVFVCVRWKGLSNECNGHTLRGLHCSIINIQADLSRSGDGETAGGMEGAVCET